MALGNAEQLEQRGVVSLFLFPKKKDPEWRKKKEDEKNEKGERKKGS